MAKILIVDDDQGIRELMEIMLTQEGYDVTSVGDPLKALEICRKISFDLVITDLKMPKVNGIEFLKMVKDIQPETIVILITAYASGETAISAMNEGAYDYVEKGGNLEELKRTVRFALQKKGVIPDDDSPDRIDNSVNLFCGMIGSNREMIKIFPR